MADKIIIKKCTVCGTPFRTSRENAKYCSDLCRKTANKKEKGYKPQIKIKKCIVCGNEFETFLSRQIICNNPECKAERHRQSLREYRERTEYDTVKKICAVCGKEFETINKRLKLTCSDECDKVYRYKKRTQKSASDYLYKRKTKKPKVSINRINNRAINNGMSYAKYVGQESIQDHNEEMRKSYEIWKQNVT